MKLKSTLTLAAVSAAAISAIGVVPSAHGVTGPNTTEPDVYQEVTVTITDTKIIVSDHNADRGEGVDFKVRNIGKKPHNFVLIGDSAIGLAHEGLGTPVLLPKKSWVLQVFMDIRGDIPYKSTLTADKKKPGMKGTFSVN
jgi:hypothetical protein